MSTHRQQVHLQRAATGVVLVVSMLSSMPVSAEASAHAVYRCGNVYSDQACSIGAPLDIADTRPLAADVARARDQARDERQLAEASERRRLIAASREKPASAGSLGPVRPAASTASAPTHKPKKKAKGKIRVVEGDDFMATAPGPAKAGRSGGPSAADAPLPRKSATPR